MAKLLGGNRLSASIVAARAGMIPASDYIEYELDARTSRIGRAVRTYAKKSGGRDDLAITSMLQDLRHYCDSKGLVFGSLDETACDYYREYVTESPWISRPSES
jgi:hypothetical protein